MSSLIFQRGGTYTGSALLDTTNLDELELIFLSPSDLFTEMKASSVVPKGVFDKVTARLRELMKWVERGHTLIVLGLMPAPFLWSGGNQGAVKTALEQLTPFKAIALTLKSGTSIQAVPRMAELFGNVPHSMSYRVVLSGQSLNPLLTVRTTQRTAGQPDIVAGFVRAGDGLIVYAPDAKGARQAYWDALERLPEALRPASKSSMPDWVDTFRTNWEVSAFDDVALKKSELQNLADHITSLEGEISIARELKRLLAGSGAEFEQAVAFGLREIGLEVIEGPHPRADLLCTDGRRIAAVEAKGVDGCAKEEYVRQVMMWMPEVDFARSLAGDNAPDAQLAGYVQQLAKLDLSAVDRNTDCKGILVLGTYRQMPIDKRPTPDFPENPVAVMVRQDICALTGLQLLGLVMRARANPDQKKEILDALFETRGVLDLCRDWKQYLTMIDGAGA